MSFLAALLGAISLIATQVCPSVVSRLCVTFVLKRFDRFGCYLAGILMGQRHIVPNNPWLPKERKDLESNSSQNVQLQRCLFVNYFSFLTFLTGITYTCTCSKSLLFLSICGIGERKKMVNKYEGWVENASVSNSVTAFCHALDY